MEILRAFPIVGLDPMGHGTKDPEITRLKKIDSSDEGLLVKLAGGEYYEDPKTDKKKQKPKDARAVIEFQCDPDRTGLEGVRNETKRNDAQEASLSHSLSTRDDESNSLQFVRFGKEDDNTYQLKLNWRTRYACDNYLRDNKGKKDPTDDDDSWGFFTWFIIMYFPPPSQPYLHPTQPNHTNI